MIRLFIPPEELTSQEIIIHGENAHYLSSVLRITTGENITIFDGHGNRYLCKINKIYKKEVIAEKIKKDICSAESPLSIVLAQGIPKGEKMDLIIQKSTELGVKKIIPLITERSQVKHASRSERWRKIALSASQQSGREKIPDIEEPIGFKDFFNPPIPPLSKGDEGGFLDKNHCGIIFSEEQKEQNLKKILNSFKDTKNIALLIGPEGGFTDTETKMANEKGFMTASLGPRILRTETAALSAISIIQYELGDMG